MEEIVYRGYFGVGTGYGKQEIVVVGEIKKETPKQIVVVGDYKYYPENKNTTFVINKSKIISRRLIV